jgi:uncharacterized protein (TIGR03435 family)
MRAALASLLLAGAASAQQPPPKFEVVSIRPVPANAPSVVRTVDFTAVLPGGQYVDSRTALLFMISFAYDVRNPSQQLAGLPEWAKRQAYSVAAKPAADFPALSPAANREQVRLMLRAMLEDRFQLRIHSETRQEPILRLEVAKGGVKIKEVDPPVPPARPMPPGAAWDGSGGRIIGNKSTMAGVASALTIMMKRPVIDATGLKGHYDFDVKWSSPDAGGEALAAEAPGLVVSMLEHQLGLRLVKATGPVTYWIVDHIAPPAEN